MGGGGGVVVVATVAAGGAPAVVVATAARPAALPGDGLEDVSVVPPLWYKILNSFNFSY